MIVENKKPHSVLVNVMEDGFVRLFCNCNDNKACVHLAAVILAIREKNKTHFSKSPADMRNSCF